MQLWEEVGGCQRLPDQVGLIQEDEPFDNL